MALSRLGGTVLTPDALVRHLRESGGFKGPLVDWSMAGTAVQGAPRACPGPLDCGELDRELDAGRPVLLRVVHDVQGATQQHWVCLTGRDARTGQYTANDPATGRTTVLVAEGRRAGELRVASRSSTPPMGEWCASARAPRSRPERRRPPTRSCPSSRPPASGSRTSGVGCSGSRAIGARGWTSALLISAGGTVQRCVGTASPHASRSPLGGTPVNVQCRLEHCPERARSSPTGVRRDCWLGGGVPTFASRESGRPPVVTSKTPWIRISTTPEGPISHASPLRTTSRPSPGRSTSAPGSSSWDSRRPRSPPTGCSCTASSTSRGPARSPRTWRGSG